MHSQPGQPYPVSLNGTNLIPEQRCACAQPATWQDFLAFPKPISTQTCLVIPGLCLSPSSSLAMSCFPCWAWGHSTPPVQHCLAGWTVVPISLLPENAIPSLSLQDDFGHCLLERLPLLENHDQIQRVSINATLILRLELFASFPDRTGISYQL